MESELRAALRLIWKDAVSDYRGKLSVYSQAVFAAGAGVSVGLVGEVYPWGPEALLPPSIVVVMVFNAVFAAYSSFIREAEAGTLDAIRMSPLTPSTFYAAKAVYSSLNIALYTILYLAVLQILAQPLKASVAFQMVYWLAAASIMLGAVASFASALMVYSEARAPLMPAVILALSAPYIGSAAPHINLIAQGTPTALSEMAGLMLAPAAFTLLASLLVRAVL